MLHLLKYKTIIKCLHVAFMVMSLNAFAYNIVQNVKSVTDDKNRPLYSIFLKFKNDNLFLIQQQTIVLYKKPQIKIFNTLISSFQIMD